ncbi:MAG: hypothetical protein HC869_02395 [Rhodospirillales bacterium]|nr:hypothetical protein [Rhodospirillales bacterium]
MRYHKATKLTRPEADFIIQTATSSRNALAVINHHEDWYDVRALTEKEFDEFLEDLLREDLKKIEAGCITPH